MAPDYAKAARLARRFLLQWWTRDDCRFDTSLKRTSDNVCPKPKNCGFCKEVFVATAPLIQCLPATAEYVFPDVDFTYDATHSGFN